MDHLLTPVQNDQITRLYHLPAKGIRTSQVESLSGYFARLSRAHYLKPGDLLRREIVWWLRGTPDRSGDWCADTAPLFLAPEMNLPGAAPKWVEVLQMLTKVNHLSLTSFLPWGGLFPSRWFLKSHHAYCPHCYLESEGRYERLLWTLGPVTVCPVHRCRLLEECPECQKKISVVGFRSLPAHCPHDYSFLGDAAHRAPIGSIAKSDTELLTAQMLAEMIQHFQRRSPRAPAYDLAACLRRLTARQKISDAAEFARFLGISRITAWYWLRGQARPSLPHVVNLCLRFGISLVDLLEQKPPSRRNAASVPEASSRTPESSRLKSAPTKTPLQEAKIRQILASLAGNPPSLANLASRLGVYPKLLKKHFPELCQQVIAKRLEHHRRYREDYQDRTIFAIRKAARYLVAEGFPLTHKNLATQMDKPGVFRWPNIRQAADQIIRELGG